MVKLLKHFFGVRNQFDLFLNNENLMIGNEIKTFKSVNLKESKIV